MRHLIRFAAILPLFLSALAAQVTGRGYVDSEVCATCHREIAAKYSRTGMGRSFFKPAPSNTVEDYAIAPDYHALSDKEPATRSPALPGERGAELPGERGAKLPGERGAKLPGERGAKLPGERGAKLPGERGAKLPGASEYYHALSDSHYRMTIRNGEYFQRRWQIGLDGKEINVEELKIDYVIGSGNHGRFYLHRTEQGMLVELPLAWYPEKGGHWALTPGSDLPQPKARTFIAYKCMFCHDAYPAIPAGHDAPGSDPVFQGALPEGIDCQRCHGPGSEHVRSSGRISMVDPAKLSFDRRQDLCLQCHLEPASGDIPAKLLRFNRGVFSYSAGEPLVDFAIFFDYAPGRRDTRFEGVGGAYQFRKSRCVIESGQKLECTSCHDPHDIPRGAAAMRHYSSVCLQCHTVASHPRSVRVSAADCTTCHMPKRRADDAPQMIFTDHRIQKRAPANALAEFPERLPDPYRGAVIPYYPSPLPETPENNLYRAVAQVGTGNNVAAGMPDLVRLLDQLKPPQPEFYIILGDGWKTLGKPAEAAAAYERALQLKPDLARAMRSLATVEPERAEEILARAVQVAPDDPQSWLQYGVVTKSVERIRKAIALNPWFGDQYRGLAELTRSDADLREALRADPFDDASWDLGGRILAEKGDFREAFFDFERAIRIRPSGQYLYDYALALVRADRFDEAQTQAELAASADVNLFEAHELLGGLHTRKNELTQAAGEYMAALALKPDLWRVHLRLGMVLAAQGKKAEAEAHFRAAASGNDPAVAQQARQQLR